jgi:hypothetical protein
VHGDAHQHLGPIQSISFGKKSTPGTDSINQFRQKSFSGKNFSSLKNGQILIQKNAGKNLSDYYRH